MGVLAKTVNGKLHIAKYRVATPAYTLFVADYSVDGPVQDGWEYFNDPETPQNIPATIDINTTAAQNTRILEAFKDLWGPATTGNDIKQWLLQQVKDVVKNYEQL